MARKRSLATPRISQPLDDEEAELAPDVPSFPRQFETEVIRESGLPKLEDVLRRR